MCCVSFPLPHTCSSQHFKLCRGLKPIFLVQTLTKRESRMFDITRSRYTDKACVND